KRSGSLPVSNPSRNSLAVPPRDSRILSDKPMKRKWICCAGLLLAAFAARAHHSFGAEYDASKPITLTGVVTKVEWTNPHSHFFMDVKDAKGSVANWKFEGYPPSVLSRTGWKRDTTLKPGDEVTVFGWRSRDGTNWAHGRQVTFSDGSKL